jgi:hypothetical protein
VCDILAALDCFLWAEEAIARPDDVHDRERLLAQTGLRPRVIHQVRRLRDDLLTSVRRLAAGPPLGPVHARAQISKSFVEAMAVNGPWSLVNGQRGYAPDGPRSLSYTPGVYRQLGDGDVQRVLDPVSVCELLARPVLVVGMPVNRPGVVATTARPEHMLSFPCEIHGAGLPASAVEPLALAFVRGATGLPGEGELARIRRARECAGIGRLSDKAVALFVGKAIAAGTQLDLERLASRVWELAGRLGRDGTDALAPATIEIGGRQRAVDYSRRRPAVRLDPDDDDWHIWPDKIEIRGQRVVTIVGNRSYASGAEARSSVRQIRALRQRGGP